MSFGLRPTLDDGLHFIRRKAQLQQDLLLMKRKLELQNEDLLQMKRKLELYKEDIKQRKILKQTVLCTKLQEVSNSHQEPFTQSQPLRVLSPIVNLATIFA